MIMDKNHKNEFATRARQGAVSGLAAWLVVPAFACLFLSSLQAEEQESLKPRQGETKLDVEATKAALAAIDDWFAKQPIVKADMVSETNDPLLGLRTEKGEMIISRPDKALRRFPGKTPKVAMLDGAILRKYDSARAKVIQKDFTQFPKLLSLLRSAFGLSLESWGDHFDVAAFKKAAIEGGKAQYRFMLTPKENGHAQIKKDFQYIEAIIEEGAAFFSQIYQKPRSTRRMPVTEQIKNITVLKELPATPFKDETLDSKPVVEEKVEGEKEQVGNE